MVVMVVVVVMVTTTIFLPIRADAPAAPSQRHSHSTRTWPHSPPSGRTLCARRRRGGTSGTRRQLTSRRYLGGYLGEYLGEYLGAYLGLISAHISG
jgi:hypothetical protein